MCVCVGGGGGQAMESSEGWMRGGSNRNVE